MANTPTPLQDVIDAADDLIEATRNLSPIGDLGGARDGLIAALAVYRYNQSQENDFTAYERQFAYRSLERLAREATGRAPRSDDAEDPVKRMTYPLDHLDQLDEPPRILDCGCPRHIVEDEGHQEGCELHGARLRPTNEVKG